MCICLIRAINLISGYQFKPGIRTIGKSFGFGVWFSEKLKKDSGPGLGPPEDSGLLSEKTEN